MTGQVCDPTTSSTPFACTITATYLGTEHIPPDWSVLDPSDYVFDTWRFQASDIDGWEIYSWDYEIDYTRTTYPPLTPETTYYTTHGSYDWGSGPRSTVEAVRVGNTACHERRYSSNTQSSPLLILEDIPTAWRVILTLRLADPTNKLVYPSGGVKLAYDVASGKLLAHY